METRSDRFFPPAPGRRNGIALLLLAAVTALAGCGGGAYSPKSGAPSTRRHVEHLPAVGVLPAKPQGKLPFTDTESVQEGVDRTLAHMTLANLAFNVPKTMRLNSSTQIEVLLSAEHTIRQLRNRITALGEKEGATIHVASRMEARLTGFGFKIEAITPETQAVGRTSVTEWDWDVQATDRGTHLLHLTLSALITVDGNQTSHTMRTFDRTIQIRVTLMDRVSSFAGRNWKWLWSAILIPIAGVLLRRRKRST